MIRAPLKDMERYFPLGDGVRKAVEFIRSNDLANFAAGRYPIDGDSVFALIQEPTTEPEDKALFEIHQRHADLQMTLKGTEYVGYAPVESVSLYGEYNPETDVQNFKGKGQLIKSIPGVCFLFFPEDAHQPYVMVGAPEKIKKVVIRIHLDTLA